MIIGLLNRLRRALDQVDAISRRLARLDSASDHVREALGRIEGRQIQGLGVRDFDQVEFKVYSQWGEDGIIQYLIRTVPIARPIFVEFGVENYTEANTRFLLVQNHWSGLIMDGSAEYMASVKRDPLYWRHNLKAVQAFVTRENINALLGENGLHGEIGLLSIDVDGNDYWIWEAISGVTSAIVVVEYNARFGATRAVTVPYDAGFERAKAHSSMIYYGASLAALVSLGRRKGYAFVGANRAGNNAFFVRRDLLAAPLAEISAADGYVPSQFRETRDAAGKLQFLSPEEESQILQPLPLVTVES